MWFFSYQREAPQKKAMPMWLLPVCLHTLFMQLKGSFLIIISFLLNFNIGFFFLAPPFLRSLQVSFVWRSTHILLPPQNIGLFNHFLFHFFFIVQPKTILLFRFIFFYLVGYQSIWRFSNRKPYFLEFLFFLFFASYNWCVSFFTFQAAWNQNSSRD